MRSVHYIWDHSVTGFRHGLNEVFAVFCAQCILLITDVAGQLIVVEDGTNKLSQNVGKR